MGLSEPSRQEIYFPYLQARDNYMVPRALAVRITELVQCPVET